MKGSNAESADYHRVGFIIVGLLFGMVMGAMDNTIVATAMGTIVANLGGFEILRDGEQHVTA